jgi:DNA-binding transcriptional ArsR family regulator
MGLPKSHQKKGMLAMTPEQAGVFNEPTRRDVMTLLAERPATVSQLAEAMGKPKGTIGYHVKELEEAGLVRVVRTRKVRALTEKYYGRLARTYLFPRMDPIDEVSQTFIAEAAEEMRPPREDETGLFTIRHARIPAGRVEDFATELIAIAERFAASPRGGDTVYGFIVGIYPTDRPSLRDGK